MRVVGPLQPPAFAVRFSLMEICLGLIPDFLVGLGGAILTGFLAMITGGFNFFAPWMVWGSIALFIAGWIRKPEENSDIWKTVLAINSSWFFCILFLVSSQSLWITGVIASATAIPTAAGMFLRTLRK